MATLYITEFANLAQVSIPAMGPSAPTQAALQPPRAEQTVALSSTSAVSAAFNANTALVRVQADTNCFVEFGTSPTATTAKMPLSAGQPEYFGVPLGASYKVAGITT